MAEGGEVGSSVNAAHCIMFGEKDKLCESDHSPFLLRFHIFNVLSADVDASQSSPPL